jgi:RHS repeat-associated protein
VTTYTYDDRNRLTAVTVGGTVVASYTYDALDRRIGFKDNGTQTWVVFASSSPLANPYADFNGSGTLLTRYVSSQAVDEIFARTSSGGTTAWYLTDRLGSVRDIVNTSGTVIDHVVYDSYGNVTTETNASNGDRFTFAGMEVDAALGQYYDHTRWYGAIAGRFTEQDPMGLIAGDVDLYRYVGNHPVCSIDSSGEYEDERQHAQDQQKQDQQKKDAQDRARIKEAFDEMQKLESLMSQKEKDAMKAAMDLYNKGQVVLTIKANALQGNEALYMNAMDIIILDRAYENNTEKLMLLLMHEGSHALYHNKPDARTGKDEGEALKREVA